MHFWYTFQQLWQFFIFCVFFAGCVFFAVYRSACAGVWGFAAVSHQTVGWWTVVNLRFFFFFKFQVAFLLSTSFTASSQPLSKLSRAFIIFFVPFFSFKCLIIFAHLFYSPQFPFSWGYRLGTSCQMATLTLEHVIISPKLFPFPFWILSLCCLL